MRKRIAILTALIVFVLTLGTSGYSFLEDWSVHDSLYMTVITLTTIGFKEVRPLSEQGRIFTIVFVFFGVGVLAYSINTGMRIIFEGEIQKALGRRTLEKEMKLLKDHYIVCGYGRMGQIICRELKAKGMPFIVIEKDIQEVDEDEDSLFVFGDATKDDLLKDAGIERATGIVSVLSTDAQNLYVVLSARGLNPDLLIIARAGEEGSEQKLIRAGADRVVSPYKIGGLRIAHTLLKPAVVDFLEFATRTGNIELQMEEVRVESDSKLAGSSLNEKGIGSHLGVIIVAIKRADESMKFNPTSRTVIHEGDVLIALGELPKLNELEQLARKS